MSVTNLKKITEKKFDVNFEKWIIEWKNLKPLCLIRITDEEEIFYNNVIIDEFKIRFCRDIKQGIKESIDIWQYNDDSILEIEIFENAERFKFNSNIICKERLQQWVFEYGIFERPLKAKYYSFEKIQDIKMERILKNIICCPSPISLEDESKLEFIIDTDLTSNGKFFVI